jgi:glucosamine 6-phosphate synthetase-like amidotransferase/phosphosugar isomerase protein
VLAYTTCSCTLPTGVAIVHEGQLQIKKKVGKVKELRGVASDLTGTVSALISALP